MLSAHRKHVANLCDAGRVEAQRLVERQRFLQSWSHVVSQGIWVRRCSWLTGEGRLLPATRRLIGVKGQAHKEHLFHGRDA